GVHFVLRRFDPFPDLVAILVACHGKERQQSSHRGISTTHLILLLTRVSGAPVSGAPVSGSTWSSNRGNETASPHLHYALAPRCAMSPQMTSTMTAPTTAPSRPAPSPALYHPIACPRKVARNAPTIPSMVVRIKPDGSLETPGWRNLASSPATNPMMIVQMIPIMPSSQFIRPTRLSVT